MADVVEATFAAVFLDGGWTALHSTFGRLIIPLIYLGCAHINRITLDLSLKISMYYTQKGIR